MDSLPSNVFNNIPATTSWGDLLARSPAFTDFCKRPNTRLSLVINNRGALFDKIKDKTIMELNLERQLNLCASSTNYANKITYFNLNLGGS